MGICSSSTLVRALFAIGLNYKNPIFTFTLHREGEEDLRLQKKENFLFFFWGFIILPQKKFERSPKKKFVPEEADSRESWCLDF